jgi:hypothetical protein
MSPRFQFSLRFARHLVVLSTLSLMVLGAAEYFNRNKVGALVLWTAGAWLPFIVLFASALVGKLRSPRSH